MGSSNPEPHIAMRTRLTKGLIPPYLGRDTRYLLIKSRTLEGYNSATYLLACLLSRFVLAAVAILGSY